MTTVYYGVDMNYPPFYEFQVPSLQVVAELPLNSASGDWWGRSRLSVWLASGAEYRCTSGNNTYEAKLQETLTNDRVRIYLCTTS